MKRACGFNGADTSVNRASICELKRDSYNGDCPPIFSGRQFLKQ